MAGFQEKPQGDGGWINGGFFVLEPGVFDMISSDSTTWEAEPLQRLAAEGQLQAQALESPVVKPQQVPDIGNHPVVRPPSPIAGSSLPLSFHR